MKKKMLLVIGLSINILLAGCSQKAEEVKAESDAATNQTDTSAMFSDRDLEIGYDEETSAKVTLSGTTASSESDAVEISENVVTITDEGTYIFSGELTEGMIIVDAEDTDKVQIVLDGVEINSPESAAIYVRAADKVFLTTASESENQLSNGGTYNAIDENNIDGVIFSKSDLTLNGAGTLNISSEIGHGIVSKDDLVLTSGTYQITAGSHGLSGKDSVRIANGTYTIECGKDGIHSDNAVVIAGGNVNIPQSNEGIEGLSIDITGGDIRLTASDDGLNAAGENDSSGSDGRGGDQFAVTEGAYIHISGGTLRIEASGDGIDSNGDLTVSGGETYVSGPTNGGNGSLDYNGEAVISGGIFMAAGSSEMAQNFGSDSTQGVMMVTVDAQSADSTISLSDSEGTEIVSWQPDKEYTCVILSCPELVQGETYTLKTGEATEQITMDSLVYGSSDKMGERMKEPGGFGGPDGPGKGGF